MKTVDLIVTQPMHIDFPGFRYFIKQNRNLFQNIFISLSNHNKGKNLASFFIQEAKDNSLCILPSRYYGGRDWRDIAVNDALSLSKSEYVLFIEQDFIVNNSNLLNQLFNSNFEIAGFLVDNSRLHPAFFYIKRDILNKTSKNFAANPPYYDHFGQIQIDLKNLSLNIALLDHDLGFENNKDWEHLAGTTHNYDLIIQGTNPNFNIKRFIKYNQEILQLNINQCSDFIKIIQKASLYRID